MFSLQTWNGHSRNEEVHREWVVFGKTLTSHFLVVRILNLEDFIRSNTFPKARYLCNKCCGMYRVTCRWSQRRVYIHMILNPSLGSYSLQQVGVRDQRN